MKKIIIHNKTNLDISSVLKAVEIHHLTSTGMFCDIKVGVVHFLSVRHENKDSVRYTIQNS